MGIQSKLLNEIGLLKKKKKKKKAPFQITQKGF